MSPFTSPEDDWYKWDFCPSSPNSFQCVTENNIYQVNFTWTLLRVYYWQICSRASHSNGCSSSQSRAVSSSMDFGSSGWIAIAIASSIGRADVLELGGRLRILLKLCEKHLGRISVLIRRKNFMKHWRRRLRSNTIRLEGRRISLDTLDCHRGNRDDWTCSGIENMGRRRVEVTWLPASLLW